MTCKLARWRMHFLDGDCDGVNDSIREYHSADLLPELLNSFAAAFLVSLKLAIACTWLPK